MSHFTVLVIGENPEEQLRPYQENNMGDCPREYMEFFDVEEENREEYQTRKLEAVRLSDGALHSRYEDMFYKVTDESKPWDKEFVLPENCELVEVPASVLYPTYQEYLEEWHGYRKDEETGKYGYWENPNAKWDWYQLGGRWTGFFRLKEGAFGERGEAGLMTPVARDGWVDAAYKRDIDFEGMANDAVEQANESYDRFEEAVAGVEPFRTTWEDFRDRYSDIDDARKDYWQIPFIKATKELCIMSDPVLKFKVLEDNPRQAYVNEARAGAFATFAVILDGKWYERGEMGWWGIVTDEKEREEWLAQLSKLIIDAPEDTLFSVFDCHI